MRHREKQTERGKERKKGKEANRERKRERGRRREKRDASGASSPYHGYKVKARALGIPHPAHESGRKVVERPIKMLIHKVHRRGVYQGDP